MVTTFSGIGAQERGFINSGLFDVDVIATSDIDKEAILSYAAIHCGLTEEMVESYNQYPNKEQMISELKEKNIGYDFLKNKEFDWDRLGRRKGKHIEKYWLALKLANNLGDITKVENLPTCDILTFSFPCQSISIAGRQEGIISGETRSGLVYEIVRLIENAKDNNMLPKYLMLENVSALVSKKFIKDFENLNSFFEKVGYNVYWSLINGKDCGIPQNRNRCFGIYIRKDIDTGKMDFPMPFDNGVRLKDVLEESVDEKYYLSDEVVKRFKITDMEFKDNIVGLTQTASGKTHQKDVVFNQNGIVSNLLATDYKQPKQICIDKSIKDTRAIEYANCLTAREDRGVSNRKSEGTAVLEQVGQIYGTEKEPNPQAGQIYSSECLSPTLDTCSGGNRMPKILQRPRGFNKGGEFEDCPSITSHSWETNNVLSNGIRIRKLTPIECWRLMGFDDIDCDNATKIGVSDSQLYKQAGNSIITNCVELLAEHLYKAQYDNDFVCFDENFTLPQMD